MDKVECEILGLSSNPATGGAYALLLKEIYGNRRLPIIIGQFEAQAIGLELEGIKPPRPLTHDLLKTLIENLGATVTEVVIHLLKDNTFHAKIVLDISSLTNEIDARPSDAIALALRVNAPIYVSEAVMAEAGFTPSKDSFGASEKEDYFEKNNQQPASREARIAALQNQLRELLEREEYERAAKIRDEIKKLINSHN